MELKIEKIKTAQQISWNHEEIKKEVSERVEKYKHLVYTDDNITDAKTDRATLNKFIKALEDKRKEVKKECMQPYEAFEKQIKEVVSIVSEPVQLIDRQVKEYENEKKEKKKKEVKDIWSDESERAADGLTIEKIFDEKWLNFSVSLKKVREEMKSKIDEINTNLITIDIQTEHDTPDYSQEIKEEYIKTLDLNSALQYGRKLLEIHRRKEAEKAAAEAAKEEPKEETVKTADTAKKTEKSGTDAALWVGFKAYITTDQAKSIAAFFKENNIKFEKIKEV